MSEREYPTIAITANEFPAPGLSPVGTVVRQFSGEHPALVRLGLRNETDRKTTVHTGPTLPFPPVLNDEDDPHGMYLVPEDEHGLLHNRDDDSVIPDAPTDGCWRPAATFGLGGSLVGFSLSAGESHEDRYVVLAPANSSECLPVGDYRFASTMHVDETGNTFQWELTVTVQ